MGGLEALRRIRARGRPRASMTLSAHDDPMHARRALARSRAGLPVEAQRSRGACSKRVSVVWRPAAAISTPRSPRSLRSRNSTAERSRRSRGCRRENSRCSSAWPAARRCKRIALDLNLSASTIGTHLYNIKQKLGVVNQSELTLIAIRHGLIHADRSPQTWDIMWRGFIKRSGPVSCSIGAPSSRRTAAAGSAVSNASGVVVSLVPRPPAFEASRRPIPCRRVRTPAASASTSPARRMRKVLCTMSPPTLDLADWQSSRRMSR